MHNHNPTLGSAHAPDREPLRDMADRPVPAARKKERDQALNLERWISDGQGFAGQHCWAGGRWSSRIDGGLSGLFRSGLEWNVCASISPIGDTSGWMSLCVGGSTWPTCPKPAHPPTCLCTYYPSFPFPDHCYLLLLAANPL